MKHALRILSLALTSLALVVWVATGAHAGWTRTSVEKRVSDEVTGIEAVHYEKGFVAGVDFLGLAVVVSAGLAVASFLLPGRKPSP